MKYRPVLHQLPLLASYGVRIVGFSATTCGLLNATMNELGLSTWGLDIMEQPLEIRANIQLRMEVASNLLWRSMELAKQQVVEWKSNEKGGVVWFATCTVEETDRLHECFSLSFDTCTVLRMVGGEKEEATKTIRAVRERGESDIVLLTTTSCAIQGIDLDVDCLVMLNAYSPVDVFQFAHRGGRHGNNAHFVLLFSINAMRSASRDDIVTHSRSFCNRFAPHDQVQAFSACTQLGVIRLVAAHVSGGVCLRVALLQAMGADASSEAMKCAASHALGCSVCAQVPNFKDLSIANLKEIAPPASATTTTTTTATTTTTTPHQQVLATKQTRLLQDRSHLYQFAAAQEALTRQTTCFACGKEADWSHFGWCQPRPEVVKFQGIKWHPAFGKKLACGYCGHRYSSTLQSLGGTLTNVRVMHSSKRENIQVLLQHKSKVEAILAYNGKFGCAVHVHHTGRSIFTRDDCLLNHKDEDCSAGLRLNVRWILWRIFFLEDLREKVEGEPFRLKMSSFQNFGAFFEHVLMEGDHLTKVNLCEQLVYWWMEGCGLLGERGGRGGRGKEGEDGDGIRNEYQKNRRVTPWVKVEGEGLKIR